MLHMKGCLLTIITVCLVLLTIFIVGPILLPIIIGLIMAVLTML